MDAQKPKVCYVITERDGKSFWTRVGTASVNRDGSLSVKLESVPIDGALHIRDAPESEPEKR